MRRIKITVDYIGTSYHGWQVQPGLDTVQARLQSAIKMLTGEEVSVQGSGRTDAGVHAMGQVAHFDTESSVGVKNFVSGLNHFLPPDIRVLSAKVVSGDFHARFSAKEKTYCYYIYESLVDKAIYHKRAMRFGGKLDLQKMRDCATAFVGEHDFTSFMSTGSEVGSAVRTVKELKVTRSSGLIKITVTANGFLYNMVRLIVGALVKAGKGELTCEQAQSLIEQKSKNAVREVMPADGLYLVKVKY